MGSTLTFWGETPISILMTNPPLDPWSILVVDDNNVVRRLISSILAKAGLKVVQSSSAPEAIEELESRGFNSFDMVLSDYWMPGGNGMDLLKQIRSNDPTLSVVLLTADGEKAILEKLMLNGGCAYLQKPVEPENLLQCIKNAVKKTHLQRKLQTTANQANEVGKNQRALLEKQLHKTWPDIDFFFTSQSQASGDFISAIDISPTQRFLLASDSSGHELSSAFQSSYFHGLARGMLHQGASMTELLELSNDLILSEWNGESSIGLSLAACSIHLNLETNILSYINAGFPRPVVANSHGFANWIGSERCQGPLGWFPENYKEVSCPIPEGYLYLWTDGLSDLAEVINVDPLALAHRFLDNSRDYEKLITQAKDDIAVARLNILNTPSPAFPVISVKINGDQAANIDLWQSYFEESLRIAFSETIDACLPNVLMCIREGLINALAHGCNGDRDKQAHVQVSAAPDETSVNVLISDPGTGHSFDIAEHSQLAADQLIPEHRGLIMMQSLPKHFEAKNNGSTIQMQFDIPNNIVANL
ncbi:response regulator [Puniceicoccaceae bacterium K14]|nr:response regulator [Puniceicoccaceae bacterium K14]